MGTKTLKLQTSTGMPGLVDGVLSLKGKPDWTLKTIQSFNETFSQLFGAPTNTAAQHKPQRFWWE
jgi:hypothetical protein